MRKLQKLLTMYREVGRRGTLAALGKWLVESVCHREVQYIRGRNIKSQDRNSSETTGTVGDRTEGYVILETPESVNEFKHELPSSFRDSPVTLEGRLEEGCFVILARKQQENSAEWKVIGYLIAERGVFSVLGEKRNVGSDVLYGHYYEVLPEFRLQGIGNLMIHVMEEYARQNGLKRYYALVSPKNAIAVRNLERKSDEILGKAERVSILRGLYRWQTPWEKIEKMLARLEG